MVVYDTFIKFAKSVTGVGEDKSMRVTCYAHGRPKALILGMVCMGFSGLSMAQGGRGGAPATPPINQSKNPMLQRFEFRSIGPAVMMGRVDRSEEHMSEL